jgi:hypothetical protein
MSAKKTPEEKSLATTTKPNKDESSTSEAEATPSTIALFDGLYHKHKHCEQCLEKDADLNVAYQLQCRSCGFRWWPIRAEFVDPKRLPSMIQELAEIVIRKTYPGEDVQPLVDRRLAFLFDSCHWYEDKTEAQKYVVRFNVFTRLIQQKNQL